jgi:biopolymer transport protein TolR
VAVKAGDDGGEMMSEINITPFTDVLLVLLIIFMVAATSVMQSDVKLPTAMTKEEANQANIIITITADEKISIGSRQLNNEELLPYLKRLKKEKNTDRVIIMADGKTLCSVVLGIMDKAKEAELTSIALATELKEQ